MAIPIQFSSLLARFAIINRFHLNSRKNRARTKINLLFHNEPKVISLSWYSRGAGGKARRRRKSKKSSQRVFKRSKKTIYCHTLFYVSQMNREKGLRRTRHVDMSRATLLILSTQLVAVYLNCFALIHLALRFQFHNKNRRAEIAFKIDSESCEKFIDASEGVR